MDTTLYSVFSSHPGRAAHLMLAHKGIDHRLVNLIPGLHVPVLRAHGFAGSTVPALELAGRRVQGTLEISRALEQLQPEPPLFPAGPELRARVIDAERWGDQTLQPFPRRLFGWLTIKRPGALRAIVGQAGLPAPTAVAALGVPVAWYLARRVGATDEDQMAELVATLPALLDQVDELLREGTIGSELPNAADFQIAATVRLLMEFGDLAPLVNEHAAARHASEILPRYPFTVPAGLVPSEWLEGTRGPAASRR